MISKSTIDQVYETARVEEVIGDFVSLKKSGTNFKGLSPFSQERTPSFMVSPVKQIWKDFSSGKGGNVVAFLMEHEHFSYPEAIRYLAKKYNIEIEETQQTDEEKAKRDLRESLFLVSEFALKYFKKTLWEDQEGKAIGFTYFKERGFSDHTIQSFDLGYAPNQYDAFSSHALKEGYALEFLEKTGLTIVNEDRKVDRFRGRVIFPIQSMSGRILGFGGRILGENKKIAKYLNSPESEIYHKSKVLYGLYQSKQSIAQADCCYLVEGYTDVIQMHQSGITNVVSSSGTALTQEQIRLIQRLTQNIVVLFDGDAAGLRAALRGVDMILAQGMNVKVCSFPAGEDPDSFARSHTQAEIEEFLVHQSQDFIQFKASLLMEEAKNDPIKKAEVVQDIVQSIALIPDAIKQEIYIKSCAAQMDVSQEVLFSTLAQKMVQAKKAVTPKPSPSPLQKVPSEVEQQPVDQSFEFEKQIITLLLLYGDKEERFEDTVLHFSEETEEIHEETTEIKARVFEKIFLDLQQDEVELAHPDFRSLYYILLEQFQQSGALEMELLSPKLNTEHSSWVSTILMEEEKYTLHQWEKKDIYVKEKGTQVAQLVNETILSLRKFLIDKKIDFLQKELKEEENDAQSILEDVMSYHQLKKVVSNKLNRVL